MKMILEINNKGEAQEALNLLNTYLGSSVVAEVVAPVETVEKKQPTRTVKPKVVEEVAPVVEEKVEEVAPVVEEVAPVKSDFTRQPATEGTTLAELKELGVKVRTAIGVTETKDIISKYATMLSEVKPADYDNLARDLKARL